MKESIQDQLLRAGLTDAKKLNAVKKNKRKQPKTAKKNRGIVDDQVKEAVRQSALNKAQHARDNNAVRDEAAKRKAINAQIKQLINVHEEPRDAAGDDFHFTDGKHIKKMAVANSQRTRLISGLLKIAKQGDSYALLPSPVADRIAQRDISRIIDCRDTKEPALTTEEQEWYKDFAIPDDLDW